MAKRKNALERGFHFRNQGVAFVSNRVVPHSRLFYLNGAGYIFVILSSSQGQNLDSLGGSFHSLLM
ncbi:hypothetical protein DPMN_091148 [Dreissena polymorpha]|uniref:Uncharacterized protein n=1 Tax=Dreissena polymorpha TaxID=45954 RepID=A0A9D4KZ21_DREPO|nr:hypothetical protein DPMN_091148 [Dreissena polymorpha]